MDTKAFLDVLLDSDNKSTAVLWNLTEPFFRIVLEEKLAPLRRNLDDFFLVVLAIITFGLQMGFLFLEAGLVRKKNVLNILFKSTLDGYVACMAFWLVGYALAWGDGNSFIGWNNFAFANLPVDKYAFALYEMVFANTASTLLNGGMAERMHLWCYFTYGILQSGVAYPILSRWGWNKDGWLKMMGFRDFSGSGIIHLYAGACGFIAACVIGPRTGRYSSNGQGENMSPHSLPLVNVGVMLLIFGFVGFNAASQLSITQPGDGFIVVNSTFNTFLACSAGGIVATLLTKILPHFNFQWSYGNLVNGALSGMVAVCAGCDSIAPWGACLTGALGGLAFILGRCLIDKLRVDDMVDSFAIHYSAGMVGLITAPFLVSDGILFKRDTTSTLVLGINLLGALAITAWAVLWCLPLLVILKKIGVLRVTVEMEWSGMDLAEHNDLAYSDGWLADGQDEPSSPTVIRIRSNKTNGSLPSGLDVRMKQHLATINDTSLRKRGTLYLERPRSTVSIHPERALSYPSVSTLYINGGESEPDQRTLTNE